VSPAQRFFSVDTASRNRILVAVLDESA
jgi:hypothetical protein